MLLCAFRLGIAWLPIRWLLPPTAKAAPSACEALTPDQVARAQAVTRALRAACRRLPWTFVCLPRALAARQMLKRRAIPCRLHFGVRRQSAGPTSAPGLDAHAWLTAGPVGVTGLDEAPGQTEIACFS